MEVEISKQSVISLNLKFNKDFEDSNSNGKSSSSLSLVVPPSDLDTVFNFVTFTAYVKGWTDEFELNAEITIAFKMSNKSKIVKEDLLKCIELTRGHLQKIINETFSGTLVPFVSPIEMDDDEQGRLDMHIQSLRT